MPGADWLDPSVARCGMQALPSSAARSNANEPAEAAMAKRRYNTHLTKRELEVLGLIVGGKSNKEIAQLLNVSSHTAKAHVANIIQKLAVDDRTQVAVKALKEGLCN